MKIPFFKTNGKPISPHCGKAFGQLLVHCLDSSNDSNQCHDTKCYNCYGNPRAKFITTYTSIGK